MTNQLDWRYTENFRQTAMERFMGGYQEVEVDFTADNPGLTLFHCHQQLHMDFGFMTLFDYL